MKKSFFALCIGMLLAMHLPAAAQQHYDYSQRQYYDLQMPPSFVVDGLRYRVLTDSTVEVLSIEGYTYPGTHTVEVPPSVVDSLGNEYRVTRFGSILDEYRETVNIMFGYDTLYSMDTLYLPEGLEVIGKYAFAETRHLHRLNIPSTVRLIDENAFEWCGYSGTLELPESAEVGELAFYRSDVDSFVTYTTGREPRICAVGGMLYTADTGRLIATPFLTADTLVLPAALRRIDPWSLRQCTVQAVLLPEGLLEIGALAFNASLQGLHIPASVRRIEGPLIEGIVPTTFQLTVDPASTHYTFGDNMLTSYGGDTLVMVLGNWTGNKILPDGIRVVGQFAFYRQIHLESMAFPEGLVEIGPYAFASSGCNKIHLPSTLERIGAHAFESIQAGYLGENGKLFLPASLRDMGSYAFAFSKTQRLKIPDSLTYIPEGAFRCFKADAIFMGRGVEHIYPHAFSQEQVGFPEPSDTYSGTNNARFVYTMPSTLKTVGCAAFYGMGFPALSPTQMAGVVFDGAPDTIGAMAFMTCHSATFGDTVPPVVYHDAFTMADTMVVPCGGTAAFTSAPGWGGFTYVEPPCPPPTAVEEADADGVVLRVVGRCITVAGTDSPVEVYDMMGRLIATAPGTVTLSAGGVYLVCIPGQPARKVVVL